MKTFRILLSLLVLTVTNCKNDTAQTNVEAQQTQNQSLLDTLQLRFNNGEKWIANIETHQGIKNMDSIIQEFKNLEAKNYKELGDKLSKQTSYIIQKCNMKGEPHDQLHVVLVPMLDEISALKDSESSNTAEEALTNLELLIKKYFTHFKYN
ncbi:MAG TPA: hypothetical protein VFF15_01090 [Flavobacteriaceae bacterium]|nr:hypothetical protein [Flavobacteriaceae bacterium]